MFLTRRQDLTWNAAPHPLPAAHSVSQPKPDIAIGVRETEPAHEDSRIAPIWSTSYMGALRTQPRLSLISHVAKGEKPTVVTSFGKFDLHVFAGASNILYPFFIFEAKSALNGPFAAANQLGGGLSYALGMLRQLRTDAVGAAANVPLHLFGAISSGAIWQLYIAYEVNPESAEMDCVGLDSS